MTPTARAQKIAELIAKPSRPQATLAELAIDKRRKQVLRSLNRVRVKAGRV